MFKSIRGKGFSVLIWSKDEQTAKILEGELLLLSDTFEEIENAS